MTPFFIDRIPSNAEYYPRGEFFRFFVPDRADDFLADIQVLDTRVTANDLLEWEKADAPNHLSQCFSVKDIQESSKRGETLCSMSIFQMEVNELHTGKEFQVYVDGIKFWIEVFRDSRRAQKLRVYVGDSAWEELHQQGILAAKDVDFVRMSHSSARTEIGVFWRYLAFDDYDYEYVYIDETDGEGEFVDGKWKRAEDKIKTSFLYNRDTIMNFYDRQLIKQRLETPDGTADFFTTVLPSIPIELRQGLFPDTEMPLFFVSEDYRLSDPWFMYRLSEYVQTGNPLLTRGPNRLPFSMVRMLTAHFERGTERILYHPSINAWCNIRERHPNLNYRYTDDQWLFHLTKILKINMAVGGIELLKCYEDQKRFGDAFFVKRIYDRLVRDGNYVFIAGKKEEGNPFNFSQSRWDEMQNYDVGQHSRDNPKAMDRPDADFTFLEFSDKKKDIDFPLPFFIATHHRSGSNLLMDLLNSTGLVATREFRAEVGAEVLKSLSNTNDFMCVLPPLRSCYSRVKEDKDFKQWGLSIHATQMKICDHLLNCRVQPNTIKWIWLIRRNKVAQALSFFRARETGVYRMNKNVSSETIERNSMEISVSCEDLVCQALRYYFLDEVWETFFNTHNITPYKIYYENFVDSSAWETTVSDVLDYLSIPHARPLNVESRTLVQSPKEKPRAYYEALKMFSLPVLLKQYAPFKLQIKKP